MITNKKMQELKGNCFNCEIEIGETFYEISKYNTVGLSSIYFCPQCYLNIAGNEYELEDCGMDMVKATPVAYPSLPSPSLKDMEASFWNTNSKFVIYGTAGLFYMTLTLALFKLFFS